ncbi:Steroid 5-alpha-reductase DET2 [Linum grandiflorum]
MMSSWITDLIFFRPLPIVAAMSVVSAVALGNAGLSEVRGLHMKYSKFFSPNATVTNVNAKKTITTTASAAASISSRNGMLLAYTPAFLSALSSLILLLLNNYHHNGAGDVSSGVRLLLVNSALAVHFLKRILEYSGKMAVETAIPISLSYLMITTVTIYTQRLTQDALLPDPSLDLKPFGLLLFLVGIAGNFYHHYLLAKLRTDSKEYKIPKGGMFNLVICPHYLFEIMGFYGIAFMSQTLYSFTVAVGTTAYLSGRSYATRKWYLSKFDDFPSSVKALIPFIF